MWPPKKSHNHFVRENLLAPKPMQTMHVWNLSTHQHRIYGGNKGPGPRSPHLKGAPHHVHVFSLMYDMCVPLVVLLARKVCLQTLLSVVQTAVFHLYIIRYCDETTITQLVFLKLGQVSESSEGQATWMHWQSLCWYWWILRLPFSDLHRSHMSSIVKQGYHMFSFWSTCPLFSWEMK